MSDGAKDVEWVPDAACTVCKGSGIVACATPFTPSEPCLCLQPQTTLDEEPLGLGALSREDVDEIQRKRTTGPTYNFFKPESDDDR